MKNPLLLVVLFIMKLSFPFPLARGGTPSTVYDSCVEVYRLSCKERAAHFIEDDPLSNLNDLQAVSESILPHLMTLWEEQLKGKISDPEVAESAIKRIQNIYFLFNPTSDQMSYSFQSNRVHVGMRFFAEITPPYQENPSLFSFIQAVSHEVAHAIDPCNSQKINLGLGETKPLWKPSNQSIAAQIAAFPFGPLSCLASSQSVGIGLDDQREQLKEPKNLCETLRLNEAFADHWASEILAKYWKKYSQKMSLKSRIHAAANVYAPHCHSKVSPAEGHWNIHPNVPTRLDWILLLQPEIREFLRCTTANQSKVFCS